MSDRSYNGRRRALLDWAAFRAEPMPLRTFIVEDSPVIRESLVAALEEMVPMKVVGQAEDSPAALRWFEDPANACDLAIIDIFLRSGSGMEVLRGLNERKHAVNRVVLTNYATPDIKMRCLALGASRVFDKSSEIDELVEYCQQLADGGSPAPGGGIEHAR
jgi:DNA-binding NarL/FixJ family response regulator